MKYNKGIFEEMIRDWQADNSPEYNDLEIEEIIEDGDTKEWVAYCHDKEANYCLTDDSNGNIVINYLGDI